MKPVNLGICFALLLLGAVVASPAAAEDLPTMSIRYLTVEADVIVIGEPVAFDGKTLPLNYRVVKVLKGAEALAKKEIKLDDDDGIYSLAPPFDYFAEDKTKPLPAITQALLFLETPEDGSTRYRPVLSGIRALTKADGLLVPTQYNNPGGQYLVKREEPTWDAMLAQLQKDLPEIAELRELKTIADPAKRNQAIFEWIAGHKNEFGGNYFTDERGFASLQHEMFEWVFESGRPEDCWRALELAVEVGIGTRARKSFCTPRGRELLLDKVFDEEITEKLRLKALDQLGNTGNLWHGHRPPEVETINVTAEEQRAIIQQVAPLLKHEDPKWRAAAVRCLTTASWPYDDANSRKRKSKHAVPDLIALYKSERNDEVRTQIAEALRGIEGEASWQKLTGNPQGIVVSVRHSGRQQDRLQFHLNLKHTRATIADLPSFRFEKLGEDGRPVQTRTIQPQPDYPKDVFEKGWSPWQGMIVLSVPGKEVEAGRWRVTVEGKIGKDQWRSEPIEISLSEKENIGK